MASKSTLPTEEFDLAGEIDDLGNLLERTKVLYEQYFLGIQKRAPEVLHRQVERRMRKIMQVQVRNTGLRFRFQTLSQKYGSYNTYWRRTMRAIEQGRYTRHLAKAGRRAAAEGKQMPAELLSSMPKRLREKLERDRKKIAARHGIEDEAGTAEHSDTGADDAQATTAGQQIRQPKKRVHEIEEDDLDLDIDNLDIDAMFSSIKSSDSSKQQASRARPKRDTIKDSEPPLASEPAATKPAPAAPRRPAPAATPPRRVTRRVAAAAPEGMSEQQTRDLYKRFVQAKKLVGADTSQLSYDRMLKTLNKQAPKIMQQHKARGVKFDVVIKDDGVVLKAKPIKS